MIKTKKNKKRLLSLITLVFVVSGVMFHNPKGSADSYTTISGADSFDTPSLLASLIYTGIGEKNTFQQSIKVSSIGDYPTSSVDDVGSQSYGNLTIKDPKTTNTQGKALQSYIYTMDAMGLSGRFSDEKPTDAINTTGYAISNNALFPHNNQGGDYHPFKKPISSAFDSMMLNFFQTVGSFWALFCDSGKSFIDKLVSIYSSVPEFFSTGGKDNGLLSQILNNIASLFGVSSFFSGMRQLIAPYMLAIVFISIAGSAWALRRKRYGTAFAGVYHVVFRGVMFLSGFALLGWTYTNLIVPFNNGFSKINQDITVADTAKTRGIDALAWGVSSNFSLDPSVTGVQVNQGELNSGKVQSSLVNNKQVIQNINQHSIDVLGKTTLSAINSPLQGVVENSKTPYQDMWDNQMQLSLAGTFTMDDYISGIETAMKAGNDIEALTNPLQDNAGLQLVAGSYFSKETSDGGENENFKDYYYGNPNNFNKDTYLFLPNSAYAGMASTDALQGNGGQQVKLVNPQGSAEGKDIKNLGNIYPFSAQKVDVKDTSSYLFNSEPTESKTKLVASTYIGSSQNIQFTDVSSTNRLAYNSNMDVTGIGSATDKDLNKLINNNAFQVILMNKEAGVNRGVSNNPNYLQLSTQSAVFFLSSSMSDSGVLNFQYPYGKNLNGSQNNSAKTAYYNRIISLDGNVQVSNVITNSFKFALYGLVFLSIISTLMNTVMLKKIIENIQSYISFLSGGHLVDFVSATTLALAFCLIGTFSTMAIAFANSIYSVVNLTLNSVFGSNGSNALMIFLWGGVSFIASVCIMFLPVIPNVHTMLEGGAVKRAKQQRSAWKAGADTAKVSGNVPLALGMAVLGWFSWFVNKLTSSFPAFITMLPLIVQRMFMDGTARQLVAVQDGGFFGNSAGVASKVDTVSEVLNKKMNKHGASNVSAGDIGDKVSDATTDALEKIGKSKKFLDKLKSPDSEPEDDEKLHKKPEGDEAEEDNPFGNVPPEDDEIPEEQEGENASEFEGEEAEEGENGESEELTPEQEELKRKEEELKETQEERLAQAQKDDDIKIIEDKTGKYTEEEKALARQRRENANLDKEKKIADRKAKEEAEAKAKLRAKAKVKKELDDEKTLMAKQLGVKKEDIDDDSAREHRKLRIEREQSESTVAELKGRQRLAKKARKKVPLKDTEKHLQARRAEWAVRKKLRQVEEENTVEAVKAIHRKQEIARRVRERREREKESE